MKSHRVGVLITLSEAGSEGGTDGSPELPAEEQEISGQERCVQKLSLVSMLSQNCLFGGWGEEGSNVVSSRETTH